MINYTIMKDFNRKSNVSLEDLHDNEDDLQIYDENTMGISEQARALQAEVEKAQEETTTTPARTHSRVVDSAGDKWDKFRI